MCSRFAGLERWDSQDDAAAGLDHSLRQKRFTFGSQSFHHLPGPRSLFVCVLKGVSSGDRLPCLSQLTFIYVNVFSLLGGQLFKLIEIVWGPRTSRFLGLFWLTAKFHVNTGMDHVMEWAGWING